jgi:hypothetical protein
VQFCEIPCFDIKCVIAKNIKGANSQKSLDDLFFLSVFNNNNELLLGLENHS